MADHTKSEEATRRPPMETSDESDKKQLKLAKDQGDALEKAAEHMLKKEAHGKEKRAGDYLVAFAIEHAEGMYQMEGGKLVWHNPTDENCHVEILVRDGSDRRFIPALTVHATLVDEDGKEAGTHLQPYLWHPWLYHYGRNWKVPGDGKYTLRVDIEAPNFPRHDKKNGLRYADPVRVEFTDVKIETGQKLS